MASSIPYTIHVEHTEFDITMRNLQYMYQLVMLKTLKCSVDSNGRLQNDDSI